VDGTVVPSGFSMSISIHRRVAALLAVLGAPLAAQTVPQTPPYLQFPERPVWAAAGSSRSPTADASLSTFSVVELPPQNGMVNGRRHHAISIPFDAARQTARQLGLGATDCALQLRLPARVVRPAVSGGRSVPDIQAQVRIACRM
jgi:hypothetical protein